MELEKIKFAVSSNTDLTESEKQSLLEFYKNYFQIIYGYDIISDYLKQIEENPKKRNRTTFGDSFVDSIDVLGSVSKDDNLALLLIYGENATLIGAGRLKKITDEFASVPDVAIGIQDEELKREIWKKAIIFAENYFLNLGFKRMYVEVPLKEPNLLIRADDLGFKENPEDIAIYGEARTYLLNKELVRNRNEEFNSGRK